MDCNTLVGDLGHLSHFIHLQYLVSIVVDHLDGNLAGGRRVEGEAFGAVERGPGTLINLGAQRPLQPFIGLVRAGEIGMPDKEALPVVIRVDEPPGNVKLQSQAPRFQKAVISVPVEDDVVEKLNAHDLPSPLDLPCNLHVS